MSTDCRKRRATRIETQNRVSDLACAHRERCDLSGGVGGATGVLSDPACAHQARCDGEHASVLAGPGRVTAVPPRTGPHPAMPASSVADCRRLGRTGGEAGFHSGRPPGPPQIPWPQRASIMALIRCRVTGIPEAAARRRFSSSVSAAAPNRSRKASSAAAPKTVYSVNSVARPAAGAIR